MVDASRMIRGSFSYLNDKVNTVQLEEHVFVRVQRVNNNVARIYLVNENDVTINLALVNVLLLDASGNGVPPYNHEFLITWTDSYRLFWNGAEVLHLANQKQQSIRATQASKDFRFYTLGNNNEAE